MRNVNLYDLTKKIIWSMDDSIFSVDRIDKEAIFNLFFLRIYPFTNSIKENVKNKLWEII